MAADTALAQLKKALDGGDFQRFYVFFGEEAYLKQYYLNQIKEKLVDPSLIDFNLLEFEGARLSQNDLEEAIDALPVMAERKLVILKDLDLFKLPSQLKDGFFDLLADLPEYLTLVVYYESLEFKADKRTKAYTTLSKTAQLLDFAYYKPNELTAWVRRRVQSLGKEIDGDEIAYLVFLCGVSMTNLIGEIQKVTAFAKGTFISKKDIDGICSPILSAVVFDIADRIVEGNFDGAIGLCRDLVAAKNEPIALLAAITRHLQRVYFAKLATKAGKSEAFLMDAWGTRYSFYVRKIQAAAGRLSLPFLRYSLALCLETDVKMKSTGLSGGHLLTDFLLSMGAEYEVHRG